MSTSNRESPEVATLYKWSWRDRLWHTPLRDILKGNLSGARDFQYSVRTSGLPKSAINTIVKTVCATRLSRNEKIEVSRELVAHFQDALYGRQNDPLQRTECSQAEVERVVHEFGNPTAVAKLIRANMIRKRSLLTRIAHAVFQGVGVFIMLAFLVLVIQFIRYVVSEPRVSRDFIVEHNNAILQAPNDAVAWPRYKQILPAALMDIANDPEWPDYAGVLPTSPHWPAQLAQLQRLAPEIAAIRQAAQLPTLGAPLLLVSDPDLAPYRMQDKNESGFSQPAKVQDYETTPLLFLIPDEPMSDIRVLARLIGADAHAAIFEKDGNRFVADLEAMIGMAKQTRDAPFRMRQLQSALMYQHATQLMTTALKSEASFLSDTHLLALDSAFASFGERERVRVNLSGERDSIVDLLQHVYSDNGQGDGHLTFQGWQTITRAMNSHTSRLALRSSPQLGTADMLASGAMLNLVSAGRKQMLDKFDQVAAEFAKNYDRPLWEWDAESEDLPSVKQCEESMLTSLRYSWVCIYCAAYTSDYHTAEVATQARDTMRVAIALARYRLAHNAFPASLDSLIPTYLDRIGPDRIDGKPIRYIVKCGKPLLYSIGMDRIDNGGRTIRLEDGKVWSYQKWISQELANRVLKTQQPLRSDFDGDVILWPRDESYINEAENIVFEGS